MIRFRFSLMRVSTGSALGRGEGERGDGHLLKLLPPQKEEGTPGRLLQGRAALPPGKEFLFGLPPPYFRASKKPDPSFSMSQAELTDS